MISLYSSHKKQEWDEFILKSKNGTFLFKRDYMDYHSDRFTDHSLMFYDGKDLQAVLPANIENNTLFSHGGLTFGGFITDSKMKMGAMLGLFESLVSYMKDNSFSKLRYKCVPYIYHDIPSDEDRYALFRFNGKLFRRDITSVVQLCNKPHFQELRMRSIRKAVAAGIKVIETQDFEQYWSILQDNLQSKHNTAPVHSLAEIEYLGSKFPSNIKLFAAFVETALLAGVVIYESKNVAHAQYIAANVEGRNKGALDLVFHHLINERYARHKYFDFGISNEHEGMYLNEGLINYKEGFGARAVTHDFYEVVL